MRPQPATPRSMVVVLTTLVLGASVGGALAVGCRSTTRDVAGDRLGRRTKAFATDAGIAGPGTTIPAPPAPEHDEAPTPLPTIIARATIRALALDAEKVYYGDAHEDAIFAVPKSGGEPVRIARRAPVAGKLAIDEGTLAWIGSPGNVVLRAKIDGGDTEALREGGIFVDVAASRGDVFIAEATGQGGTIHRTGRAGSTRVATVDALPRGLAVSDDDVIVATSTKLLRIPRGGGDAQLLATGAGFSYPQIDPADPAFVDVTATAPSGTGVLVVRVPLGGGRAVELGRTDRRTPLVVSGGELFFIAGDKARLVASATNGGPRRTLSEAEAFEHVSAMAADEQHVFVATTDTDQGLLLSVPRRPDAKTSSRVAGTGP